jgi:hypothetical protein
MSHTNSTTTTVREAVRRTGARTQRFVWTTFLRLRPNWEPIDERGGGRNSDEGMHIGAGAVIAGTIAAGIAAFVASKLGALDEVK